MGLRRPGPPCSGRGPRGRRPRWRWTGMCACASMTPRWGVSHSSSVSVGACGSAVMMATGDSTALSRPARSTDSRALDGFCASGESFDSALRSDGMDLEVRHLRALCAIADTGSLHRAARQLGVAQPSLSTQLRRIEQELGGALFVRARTGCRPTPLGSLVLSRARPVVAEMRSLVSEARAAALGGQELRVGSTASKALAGWLRRLRTGGQDPTLHMNVSPNALLRMVADGQLDVAFVHEVEGSRLRIPEGLRLRVLVEREPQFVYLAADHPATAHRVVDVRDLAGDRWMIDPTVDGEWEAVQRMFR